MGRFVENKVSCHTLGRMSTMTLWTVRSVSRPYIRFEISGRTSISPLVLLTSKPTPKPTKGFLGLSKSKQNLHAM
jgi:hypothetical protein